MKPLLATRLSTIQKICLCALFIALTTLLQKVIAINYISVLPFLRISLGGPALIIFTSIFLGPIYGLFVGACSDILGYFLLDMSSYSFFPQITAIYALLGLLSYFVFYTFKLIKNQKVLFIIQIATMVALFIFITVYIALTPEIKLYSSTYTFALWQKILIPVILGILMIGLIIAIYFINKKYTKDNLPVSPVCITFSCFILELLVMTLFGSLMKGLAFGFQTYGIILLTQIIVLFINVPLNSFFVILFLKLTKRFYKVTEVEVK